MAALAGLWWIAIPGVVLALYGPHRLCLWLEERGHLYYIHKQPRGGAGGGFMGLQKLIEPGAQHVFQIREEKRGKSEEGTPGSGDWPTDRTPFGSDDETQD
jgi:hypothetical protein